MRTIIIVSTRNTNVNKFENVANDLTYGQVKDIVGRDEYPWSEMQAIESIGKTALLTDESTVPNGDVKIFLRPTKTKSGVNFQDLTPSEIRNIVREDEELKALIKEATGKNWTIVNSATMKEVLLANTTQEDDLPVDYLSEIAKLQKKVGLLEKRVAKLESMDRDYEEEDYEEEDYEEEDTSEYDAIMNEFEEFQ